MNEESLSERQLWLSVILLALEDLSRTDPGIKYDAWEFIQSPRLLVALDLAVIDRDIAPLVRWKALELTGGVIPAAPEITAKLKRSRLKKGFSLAEITATVRPKFVWFLDFQPSLPPSRTGWNTDSSCRGLRQSLIWGK